jgi:hypothetical protein
MDDDTDDARDELCPDEGLFGLPEDCCDTFDALDAFDDAPDEREEDGREELWEEPPGVLAPEEAGRLLLLDARGGRDPKEEDAAGHPRPHAARFAR